MIYQARILSRILERILVHFFPCWFSLGWPYCFVKRFIFSSSKLYSTIEFESYLKRWWTDDCVWDWLGGQVIDRLTLPDSMIRTKWRLSSRMVVDSLVHVTWGWLCAWTRHSTTMVLVFFVILTTLGFSRITGATVNVKNDTISWN